LHKLPIGVGPADDAEGGDNAGDDDGNRTE